MERDHNSYETCLISVESLVVEGDVVAGVIEREDACGSGCGCCSELFELFGVLLLLRLLLVQSAVLLLD